jgi:atlastin
LFFFNFFRFKKRFCFLIRDWPYSREFNYGFDGGKRYLDKKAAEKLDLSGKNSDNRKTLDAVFSSFSNVDCFLMPHPGLIAHTSDSFKPKGLRFFTLFNVALSDVVNKISIIQLKDLDKKFLSNVKVFVEELLSTKSIVKNLKKVNQRHLLCSDFADFLRNNFQKFSTDHFNVSLSWFDSSAEIHFAKAHKEAYEFYMKNMTKVITNKFLRKHISAFHHVIVFSS